MDTIAILIDSLKSGGAQKQSALLAKVLSKTFKVVYVIFDDSNSRQSFVSILEGGIDIKVEALNGNKLTNIYKLVQLFKQYKPVASFSYLPYGNFINGIAGKISNIKHTIGGIRNSEVEYSKLLFEKFSHNYFLESSISNSEAGKVWHRDKGFNKPIFYIPNCFPLDVESIERSPTDNLIKVLSVGRFVEQKNYDLALECILECKSKLQSTSYDIHYTIVGYGPLEESIRDKITTLGLNDTVDIVLNPVDMHKFYSDADIYLCTSKFEGMSNSIMEAMSFSLPIVATDVGGNPALVEDGINGFLTEETISSVSTNIMKLIEHHEQRHRFGHKSYELLKNNFSEDAFAKHYQTIINNLDHENIRNRF